MTNSNCRTEVLFIWEVREQLQKYLIRKTDHLDNIELIFPIEITEEFLLEKIPSADIAVGWRPSRNLLEKAVNLKLFINPGAGVQHLIELFKEINESRDNIALANGHGNSYFTAQHAVAMLLSLMNKIILHHNWMIEGKWRKRDKDAASDPLRHRKIGLLAYGNVNSKVHKFLTGFNVDFSILRNNWTGKKELVPNNVKKYTIEELNDFLTEVDILIIAVPLTVKTRGLIGYEEIKLLGKDGLLVNVSRGDVVDEEGLYRALKEKQISGAAIDVWYNYRPDPDVHDRLYPFNKPFNDLDNIILSPHRGGSPFNDLYRWNEVVENIERCSKGRKDFINTVDLEKGY